VKYILISFLLLIIFLSYKPFSPIYLYNDDDYSRFQYIQNNKIRSLFSFHTSELSNIFTTNVNSVSYLSNFNISQINIKPLNSTDELSTNSDFFANTLFFANNFSSSTDDNLLYCLKRTPLSTFGITYNSHLKRKRIPSSEYSVFKAGTNEVLLQSTLPEVYVNLFEGKILDSLEYFFHIHNNVILGTPIVSKSSGTEDIDRTISHFLKNASSSMGLADGYYRFNLSL